MKVIVYLFFLVLICSAVGCKSGENDSSIYYVKEYVYQTGNFRGCDQILNRGDGNGFQQPQTDELFIKLKVWRMDGENIYSAPENGMYEKNDDKAMAVHFRMNELFYVRGSDKAGKLPILYYHTEYHPLPQSSLLLLLAFDREKIMEMCSKSNKLLLIFEDKYFSESVLEFQLITI